MINLPGASVSAYQWRLGFDGEQGTSVLLLLSLSSLSMRYDGID